MILARRPRINTSFRRKPVARGALGPGFPRSRGMSVACPHSDAVGAGLKPAPTNQTIQPAPLSLFETHRYTIGNTSFGAVAQLGERIVRNDEVGGSNPPSSTIPSRRSRALAPQP